MDIPPPPDGFVVDAPSAAPPVTPIIPRTPAPQTPAQASKDVSEATTSAETAKQAQYKTQQEELATQKLELQKFGGTEDAYKLINGVERARGLVSDWSTGMSGAALQHLPSTDAYALNNVINQEVRGNVFMQRIAALKDENPSPNGGTGIGRIMQAEIPMITGSSGTLDVGMKGSQLGQSFDQIENGALRFLAKQNGENPDDPAVLAKYKKQALSAMPSGGTDNGGGTDTTPPAGPIAGNLTSDQQHAYGAFLSANPNPTGDQLNAFLSKLTGKQVTNGNDIAKAIASGAGVSSTTEDLTEQQKVKNQIAAENKAGINQDSDASRIFTHGATLGLSDEASGVGNALANVVTSPFTGKFDPVGAYHLGTDVERQRLADAEQRMGAGGTALDFAGSLASGNPENAVSKVTDLASFIKNGARAGGAYGVVSGYGQGQGTEQSLVGAGVGGVEGATVGALAGRFLRGRDPISPPSGGPAPGDIANALQTEGIPAARPIADPSVRGNMAALETTKGGHNVVRDSLEQTRQGIADKVAGLAGEGDALTPGIMGETVQNAGTRTLNDAKTAARAVYTQADKVSAGAPINPTEGLAKLDGYISQLSRNPETNSGVISYLQGVRNDLASQGGKTVGDIRDIITGAEDKINYSNLQKTRAEAIMSDVNKSLNTDVTRDLGQANPEALALYNKADGMWRDMSDLRNQVVRKLIGPADNPLSGEQTMTRVQAMMGSKGDLNRFNRTMNMMTPDEQASFRASLFENVGQKSPEEPFSPAYFLGQTKNMQADALKTVFGEDGAKSVQNLRVASRGFADAQNSLNNSRTTAAQNLKGIVSSIINLKSTTGGAIGAGVAGIPGALVGAAAGDALNFATNRLSAKALMNPDVSQWIRKVAAAKTDTQARALIGKLNGIAAGNAAIQPEVAGLRDFIMKAMNDNAPAAGSAAASPNGGPNQQQ